MPGINLIGSAIRLADLLHLGGEVDGTEYRNQKHHNKARQHNAKGSSHGNILILRLFFFHNIQYSIKKPLPPVFYAEAVSLYDVLNGRQITVSS